MIEKLKDFSGNIVAFQCKGHVTRLDYDTVLIPAVETALKEHERLRLFYKIDSDFTGIDPSAIWEDVGVGVQHLLRWERIAVVTDVDWIGHAIRAFGFLMPGKVRVFPLAEEGQAVEWIHAP